MAMPLPVNHERRASENDKLSQATSAELAHAEHAAEPVSASDEEPGVSSAMILSLVDKLPNAPTKDPTAELARLEEENRRLRTLLDQARERLNLMEREAARWRQREQEYEALLEEKSELIRQLHQELQLAKERPAPDRRVPREEELLALEQELLREREQLKRDEEQLMAEIRQMEVALSRERADLARQRNELQRLHQQIQTELEIASREAALRERLAPLYELHAELQRRYFGEVRPSRRPLSRPSLPEMPSASRSAQPTTSPGARGSTPNAGPNASAPGQLVSSADQMPCPSQHPVAAENTIGSLPNRKGTPAGQVSSDPAISPRGAMANPKTSPVAPIASDSASGNFTANPSSCPTTSGAAPSQSGSNQPPAKPGLFRRLFGLA